MDGHRGGDHQGSASQNPAYRPAHRHHLVRCRLPGPGWHTCGTSIAAAIAHGAAVSPPAFGLPTPKARQSPDARSAAITTAANGTRRPSALMGATARRRRGRGFPSTRGNTSGPRDVLTVLLSEFDAGL